MVDFCLFYPEGHEAHKETGHPERPERLESIRQALLRENLWKNEQLISPIEVPLEVLENIHTPEYLSLLERTCRRGGHLDADTYVTQASWDLALKAAGGAVAVVNSVWSGKTKIGFGLTRPPGHHAMRGQGMGFCLLNNIAIGAEYIIKIGGAKKVAIVDLDLHHGNGTQDIFWSRRDVFFISTHQSPLYPGTGSLDERGANAGMGYTANLPLPPGSGDSAFHVFMDEVILPLLARFQPEILLISYGFDTHWSDPLGHLLLSGSGYAGLIDKLRKFANVNCEGKIALILEGGYDLDAAANCTVSILNAVQGFPWMDPLGPSPYYETDGWKKVLKQAKQLWDL